MRTLIVGATGSIGRVLYRYLLGLGWDVAGTCCQSPQPGFARYCLETDDPAGIVSCGGLPWEVAIVCAGLTRIDDCKRFAERSRAVNVAGTKRLLQHLVDHGVKPVFLSTDYVFSGARGGGYREEDPPDPITVYGRQKVEVERFLAEITDSALIVRLSKVFGTDPADGTLLAEWHQGLSAGRVIRCATDQIFSPTLVDDVTAGLARLIAGGATGIYHLARPERLDRAAMLRQFVDFLGIAPAAVEQCVTSQFGFLDNRGGDTSLDSTKFLQETGFCFTSMPEAFSRFAVKLSSSPQAA